MKTFLSCIPITLAVVSLAGCVSTEEQSRRHRYAWRELNFKLQLENAELDLDNAKMERKKLPLAISTYMLGQTRKAIETKDRFADIWSYTIDHDTMKVTAGKTGDEALQRKFSDAELHFDDANSKCTGERDSHTAHSAYKTVAEAEANCTDLNNIYLAVVTNSSK